MSADPHPPATIGNKEADDDIAAFYRAKEELERRKSATRTVTNGERALVL